ncbi:hypothetical protein ACFL6D_03965 [Spirochaetota bacterium]
MRKNFIIIITSSIIFIAILMSLYIFPIVLMNKNKALKQMFPDADKINEVNKTMTAAQMANIKKRLGGKLYMHSPPRRGGLNKATFYFGIKANKNIGVAMIEEQNDSKWGMVEFIVVMDRRTGAVKNMAMMSYIDRRARLIARRSFLRQFWRKKISDPIAVYKDIVAISGATVSTATTCFIVKKAVVSYYEIFLKKSK